MKVWIVLLALFLFSGCFSPARQVDKWYSIDDTRRMATDPEALISVFTIDVPNPQSKTIFDLSERAQAALITQLASKLSDPSKLLSQTGAKLGQEEKLLKNQDLTTFKRRLVLSVENRSQSAVDRIQKLRIELAADGEVTFKNWDKAATAYETIDLGKLSFDQERSGNVSANFSPPQLQGAASIGTEAAMKNTLREELNLKRRIVDLNVAIIDTPGKPNIAVINRDGAPGRDLAGNIIVDFELSVNKSGDIRIHQLGNLFSDDGSAKNASEVTLRYYNVTYPLSETAIMLTAKMSYDIRHVAAGGDTVEEGDDTIRMVSGVKTTQATLIPKDLLRFIPYQLGNLKGQFVVYDTGQCTDKDPAQLRFKTVGEGYDLHTWLRKSRGTFGDKITFSRDNYVLCLFHPVNKDTRLLASNEIEDLIVLEVPVKK